MARPNFDKTTGQSYSAAEWGQLKDKNNNPGLNDAWSSIVKFDDEYFPPDKTMTGAIEYTIDATDAGTGNGRKDIIVGDGNTITFTGFTVRKSSLNVSSNVVTTVSGNTYTIVFLRVGSISEVYLATNSTSGFTQLTPPTNFAASAGDTQNSLSWSGVQSATGYVLEFYPDTDIGNWQAAPAYDGTSESYNHTSLTNGVQYSYRLKATANGYTDSAYVQTTGTPSIGVTVLTAPVLDTITASNSQMTLDFTNNGGGNEDDTLPQYRETLVGGAWTNATPFVTGSITGIVSGLVNDTEYDFQLIHRGSGSYSNSIASNTLTGTPISGSIYSQLTLLKHIYDDDGLVTNTDNDYGNIDASNNVVSWKPITPGLTDATEVLLLTAGTDTLPTFSSGINFDGTQAIQAASATDKMRYLVTRPLAADYKWTAHIVINPDSIPTTASGAGGIFGGSLGALNNAFGIFLDNRISGGSTYSVRVRILNESQANVVYSQVQNTVVPDVLQVITIEYDHSKASANLEQFINGVSIGTDDKQNDPSTDTPNPRYVLGILSNLEFKGVIRNIIFEDGIETPTVRNNFIADLMSKYSIV